MTLSSLSDTSVKMLNSLTQFSICLANYLSIMPDKSHLSYSDSELEGPSWVLMNVCQHYWDNNNKLI